MSKSWQKSHAYAVAHLYAHDYEQCIKHAKRALVLQKNLETLKCLVHSYGHIGKEEASLRALELCLDLKEDCFDDAQIANIYLINKRFENAINVLINRLTKSNDIKSHRVLNYAIHSQFTSSLDPTKRLALDRLWRRTESSLWSNKVFAEKYGLSRGNEDGRPSSGCNPYHEIPLSKIHELLELCNTIGVDPQDFHLIDLGGGKGISTLFFSHRCRSFKSITSIEIQNQLVEIARNNLATYNASQNKSIDIHFIEKDAATVRLKNQPYFMFAYNPFPPSIWGKFIEKNIDIFSNHKAILALYSPRCLNITHKYCDVIGSSSFGQCMILRFQKNTK